MPFLRSVRSVLSSPVPSPALCILVELAHHKPASKALEAGIAAKSLLAKWPVTNLNIAIWEQLDASAMRLQFPVALSKIILAEPEK